MGKTLLWGEKRQKKWALDQMEQLEAIKDFRDLSGSEMVQWSSLKQLLDDIYLEEEMYWKLRSRQKWVHEGDYNTRFFL